MVKKEIAKKETLTPKLTLVITGTGKTYLTKKMKQFFSDNHYDYELVRGTSNGINRETIYLWW